MSEVLDIVDENDNIIGRSTYNDVHGNNKLIHRAANVLVINSKNEILLQKRSRNKLVEPSKWDLSSTGHVKSGETYEEAARRELKEEIGLENMKLIPVGKTSFKDNFQREFNMNYIAKFNGDIKDIKFDKEEVEEVKFMSINQIKKLLKERKEIFAHWFEGVFNFVMNNIGV